MSGIRDPYAPRLTGGTTQLNPAVGTTTYNEAGVTYNQTGLVYGGMYGFSDVVPSLSSSASLFSPTGRMGTSQAFLAADQSITYNQTGVSYNESGIQYAGLYGFADADLIPRLGGGIDIYTAPVVNLDQSSGPGFFMFITH